MTKDDFVIICGDFGGVWNKGVENIYANYYKKPLKFLAKLSSSKHKVT
jgi:hypothetical protein